MRRQANGRPTKVWVVELGYSADTRYLEKVQEKTDQHEVLCNLLRAEGYEVIFLPIVLGTAGTLYKCLEKATTELRIPPAQRKKLFTKLHLHSVHTLYNILKQRRYLERQQGLEARGRIRGR